MGGTHKSRSEKQFRIVLTRSEELEYESSGSSETPDPNQTEKNLNEKPTAEKFNDDLTFDHYNSTTEGGLATIINEETIDSIDLYEKERGLFENNQDNDQQLTVKEERRRRKKSYDINFYKEID